MGWKTQENYEKNYRDDYRRWIRGLNKKELLQYRLKQFSRYIILLVITAIISSSFLV